MNQDDTRTEKRRFIDITVAFICFMTIIISAIIYNLKK
jgi:hypothetical protein